MYCHNTFGLEVTKMVYLALIDQLQVISRAYFDLFNNFNNFQEKLKNLGFELPISC